MTRPWTIPTTMWENGEAWIIGGGSSIPHQFGIPEEVINEVATGASPMSKYSPYMKAIHSKNVVGVNVAYKLGNWIKVALFCDSAFWRNEHEQFMKFPNLKVTDCGSLNIRGKNIKGLKRLDRNYQSTGLSVNPTEIRWNFNSGAAAINFCTLAGAKRIILLGFDCTMVEGRTHFHEGEKAYATPTVDRTFKKFLSRYDAIATDAKKLGVEIINANPDSAITQFKKVDLKDIL
jgi:hypothetical protein